MSKKPEKIITFEEEKKINHLKEVFTNILVMACLVCVVQAILYGIMYFLIKPLNNFYSDTFFYMLSRGLCVFIPFYLYNFALGNKVSNLFSSKDKASYTWYFLGTTAAIALTVVCLRLSYLFVDYLESVGFTIKQEVPDIGSNVYERLFFFLMTVIPAVLFEITFRGIALENIKKENTSAAVLLTSFVSIISSVSLYTIPYTLVLGFIAGWIYLKTSSIKLTIFIHIGINLVISYLYIKSVEMGDSFYRLFNSVSLFCLVIGLISLLTMVYYFRPNTGIVNSISGKEAAKWIFKSYFIYAFIFIVVFQLFFYQLDKPSMNDRTSLMPITTEDDSAD